MESTPERQPLQDITPASQVQKRALSTPADAIVQRLWRGSGSLNRDFLILMGCLVSISTQRKTLQCPMGCGASCASSCTIIVTSGEPLYFKMTDRSRPQSQDKSTTPKEADPTGSGEKGDGFMARLTEMYRRLSSTELAKMLLFT